MGYNPKLEISLIGKLPEEPTTVVQQESDIVLERLMKMRFVVRPYPNPQPDVDSIKWARIAVGVTKNWGIAQVKKLTKALAKLEVKDYHKLGLVVVYRRSEEEHIKYGQAVKLWDMWAYVLEEQLEVKR